MVKKKQAIIFQEGTHISFIGNKPHYHLYRGKIVKIEGDVAVVDVVEQASGFVYRGKKKLKDIHISKGLF